MNQRVTSHRSLRASGLVLLGAVPLLASDAFAGSSDALTPDELRLLIATARERLPRYSLEYSVYAEGGLLGGKWVYAVAEPANPRSSVRLTVETPVPEELAAEAAAEAAARGAASAPDAPDVVVWGFDATIGRAYAADEVGQLVRRSQSGRTVGLAGVSSDFEQLTGMAPLHAAAFGADGRADLLDALLEPAARVSESLALRDGQECVIVDLPLLTGGMLAAEGSAEDNRLRYWIAPALGYAQVACETVIAGELRMRRSASDFVEVAAGAPHLPLHGTIEMLAPGGAGAPRLSQLAVLRNDDGSPRLLTGEAVVVEHRPSVGTTVRDLDTGEVHIATANWAAQAESILARHGVVRSGELQHAELRASETTQRAGLWMLAAIPLIGGGGAFAAARRRRATQVSESRS